MRRPALPNANRKEPGRHIVELVPFGVVVTGNHVMTYRWAIGSVAFDVGLAVAAEPRPHGANGNGAIEDGSGLAALLMDGACRDARIARIIDVVKAPSL